MNKLEQFHIAPRALDDLLSNDIFLNFTQLLDPNQLYFNQANIADLARWRYEIDDFIENRNCTFLDSLRVTYKNRIIKAREILDSFNATDFDFTKPDTLNYNYIDLPDPRLENRNLRGAWEHRIKYTILGKVWPDSLTAENIQKAFSKVQSEQKLRLRELMKDQQKFDELFEYKFLKAIAKSYDPHTSYFSSSDKEDFDASISNQDYSYGLELSNDELGNIVVAKLIPGSYAWQSNKIHDGDILLKMRVAGGKEIDIADYDASELEDMLSEYDSKIELTIRKTNGSLSKVRLEKQKINSNENIVKSLILDGPNKIAYISLPSFYSKVFGGTAGCSADLASEILTLKKEGIDGIIIDLRNNGGGSMQEAVELSGIFVDGGAISITKERDQSAKTLKDPNRGTLYSGPLVVMINGASASASELFSGAIQDHRRGILVGSRTYGKATGQNILPLASSRGDFLKVTTLKFYRVTGDTHQGHGIQPDIFLPGLEESLGRSEDSYSNALKAQHINKKTYYTALDYLPISELSKASRERVQNSPQFDSLKIRKVLHDQYFKNGKLLIPVSIKGYEKFNTDFFKENEVSAGVWDTIKIKLVERDEEISGIDTYGAAAYRVLSQDLKKDIHLREAYNIIGDYIELKKD